jgi:hypothetical protein
MIEARTAGSGSKSFRIDHTGIAMPEAAFRRVWEIRPNRDEAIVPLVPRNGGCHHIGFITVALLALGLGCRLEVWVASRRSSFWFALIPIESIHNVGPAGR